jgi:RNA polymerase sigma factor (sigma-70 family)
LFAALDRFDPSRGVTFAAYAGHRIRGAMLDGLRERDPLPRAQRRAMKVHEGAGIQFLEIDDALGVPADEGTGPEAIVLESDLRGQLLCGFAALPPRDREVLALRMGRGLPLRVVASRLSLSVTRVAEIQKRGVIRLRRFLAGEPMSRPRRRGPVHPRSGQPTALLSSSTHIA